MQCPSCRSEISDNQFYCPVCRASVYSYTPENVRTATGGNVARSFKFLRDIIFLAVLIVVGVVIGRAIKWKELLSNFLPGIESAPTKSERGTPNSSPGSSGKRAPDASKDASKSSAKTSEGKAAESDKPASAESVRDLKQKIEELPASSSSGSSGETKPTPKPTPKPPSNND